MRIHFTFNFRNFWGSFSKISSSNSGSNFSFVLSSTKISKSLKYSSWESFSMRLWHSFGIDIFSHLFPPKQLFCFLDAEWRYSCAVSLENSNSLSSFLFFSRFNELWTIPIYLSLAKTAPFALDRPFQKTGSKKYQLGSPKTEQSPQSFRKIWRKNREKVFPFSYSY